jgi:hypothetical protein
MWSLAETPGLIVPRTRDLIAGESYFGHFTRADAIPELAKGEKGEKCFIVTM